MSNYYIKYVPEILKYEMHIRDTPTVVPCKVTFCYESI